MGVFIEGILSSYCILATIIIIDMSREHFRYRRIIDNMFDELEAKILLDELKVEYEKIKKNKGESVTENTVENVTGNVTENVTENITENVT
jgi:hypothetical protein